jgi:single-stranded DNA-binding protein
LDQWTNQDGQKRSRLYVRADNFQFLEPRSDSGQGEGGSRYQRGTSAARGPVSPPRSASEDEEPRPQAEGFGTEARGEEEIPF